MATDFPIITTGVLAMPTAADLSFAGRRSGCSGTNLWDPATVVGSWDEQCRVGREYGREAVSFIRKTNDAAVLSGIVRTIAERATFGGVEVGFFAALSMSLIDTE